MTRVLIVVLNWNGIDDTERCLDSLQKQDYPHFDIAVVDNGSIDDSVSRLETISSITLLRNQKNLGFAGGVNTGIKYALENDYDGVALFNNDAIASPDWLSNLTGNLNDETAIVTGLLLHADGKTIDTTGESYSIWGAGFPTNRNNTPQAAPDSQFIFGATGGASLYKTSLFKQIGLFDETFFAYYEDADISFRAQLAGYKVYYTKDAVAYHKQGATSKKIPGFTVYQTFKNLPLLFWKNVPTKLLLRVGSRFFLLYTLIFGNAIKNGAAWPALKGLVASIWYFWTSALWKRLKIQSSKKVSADYIWSVLYHDLPPEQTGMRKFRDVFIKR